MGSSSEAAAYAAFEEKVKQTVFLDNLSPQVTESVLKTALNQFGNVTNVQFVPNYIERKNIPAAALVEMENAKQANQIIAEITNFPFMMSGMPRPVRAHKAEIGMFDDRPKKPGRRIVARWLDPNDPTFETAKKIKQLTGRHATEASFMLEKQLAEEEKLHKQQTESLKANYKKFDLIDSVQAEGSFRKLESHYKMKLGDG